MGNISFEDSEDVIDRGIVVEKELHWFTEANKKLEKSLYYSVLSQVEQRFQ